MPDTIVATQSMPVHVYLADVGANRPTVANTAAELAAAGWSLFAEGAYGEAVGLMFGEQTVNLDQRYVNKTYAQDAFLMAEGTRVTCEARAVNAALFGVLMGNSRTVSDAPAHIEVSGTRGDVVEKAVLVRAMSPEDNSKFMQMYAARMAITSNPAYNITKEAGGVPTEFQAVEYQTPTTAAPAIPTLQFAT